MRNLFRCCLLLLHVSSEKHLRIFWHLDPYLCLDHIQSNEQFLHSRPQFLTHLPLGEQAVGDLPSQRGGDVAQRREGGTDRQETWHQSQRCHWQKETLGEARTNGADSYPRDTHACRFWGCYFSRVRRKGYQGFIPHAIGIGLPDG